MHPINFSKCSAFNPSCTALGACLEYSAHKCLLKCLYSLIVYQDPPPPCWGSGWVFHRKFSGLLWMAINFPVWISAFSSSNQTRKVYKFLDNPINPEKFLKNQKFPSSRSGWKFFFFFILWKFETLAVGLPVWKPGNRNEWRCYL